VKNHEPNAPVGNKKDISGFEDDVVKHWKKHVWNLFWGNGTENTARRVSS